MPEFQREMSTWIHEGKITWKETIEHGIENAPTAFLKLFSGENFGKMLVKRFRCNRGRRLNCIADGDAR
jgi:NADPH-dependent curcumin reductase CurA